MKLAKTYRGYDSAADRREEYDHRYWPSEADARAAILPGEALATRSNANDGWQYRGYCDRGGGWHEFTGWGKTGHSAPGQGRQSY